MNVLHSQPMKPLVASILERHPAGCCWHVVIDDGNVDDLSVEVCVAAAQREGHSDCLALAPLMVAADEVDRGEAVGH